MSYFEKVAQLLTYYKKWLAIIKDAEGEKQMTTLEKLELLDELERRNAEAESRYMMQRKERIKAAAQAQIPADEGRNDG